MTVRLGVLLTGRGVYVSGRADLPTGSAEPQYFKLPATFGLFPAIFGFLYAQLIISCKLSCKLCVNQGNPKDTM